MESKSKKSPAESDDEDRSPESDEEHRNAIIANLDRMFSWVAYPCGVLAVLLTYLAYVREMYPPPGRSYGKMDLEGVAILVFWLVLFGIPSSCLPRIKLTPLLMNLLAAIAIAAPFVAEIFFHANFPPRMR